MMRVSIDKLRDMVAKGLRPVEYVDEVLAAGDVNDTHVLIPDTAYWTLAMKYAPSSPVAKRMLTCTECSGRVECSFWRALSPCNRTKGLRGDKAYDCPQGRWTK